MCSRSPLDIGLYLSMFPHLIAGPIVSYRTIAKALVKRCITFGRMSFGMRLFVIGLAQKVLLADTIESVSDKVFGLPLTSLDVVSAWTGTTAYTLQIYYDFCGYSFMAIGIGIIVGFRLSRNFRYPYFSQSITEFWRRWHISLSTSFRDYLYIPLGGNRKGMSRTLANLLVVFFLCGLWHGAAYTFVFWGLFHGLLLIVERLGLKRVLARVPRIFRHGYAVLGVMVGWVFFRADTISQAFAVIGALLGMQEATDAKRFTQLVNHEQLFSLLLGILFATPVIEWGVKRIFQRVNRTWSHAHQVRGAVRLCSLTALFVLALTYVFSGTYSPFLYFRF